MFTRVDSTEKNNFTGRTNNLRSDFGLTDEEETYGKYSNLLSRLNGRSPTDLKSSGTGDGSASNQGLKGLGFIGNLLNGIGRGIAGAFSGVTNTLTSIWDAFISQFQGSNNLFAHGDNTNCGPTALAIIADLFGVRNVTPTNAHDITHEMRDLMGAGQDEGKFTNVWQIAQGARNLGLETKLYSGAGNLDTLKKELDKGNVVIANVDSREYGGKFEHHFAVVTNINETTGMATILDPGLQTPIQVPISQLNSAISARSGYMVSIGDGSGPQRPTEKDEHTDNGDTSTSNNNGWDLANMRSVDNWFSYFSLS